MTLSELAARLNLDRPLAFVDLETTGVNTQEDRIVEIGILRVSPDGAVDRWESLVNPGGPIPSDAIAVHHITDAMVQGAPAFGDLAITIHNLLVGCDLAGYNLRKFDRPMLVAEFARIGRPWPCPDAKTIDPFLVFLRMEPRDLESAVQFYCGDNYQIHEAGEGRPHRALFDAAAAAYVLLGQCGSYEDLPSTVDELHTFCENRDPSWLDADGKIAWRNGQACITFGKNAGRSLRDLARSDRGFLAWMLAKDFPIDTKRIVKEALDGRFPVAPAEVI
jgi:DNA polymerase III subunit epsilon